MLDAGITQSPASRVRQRPSGTVPANRRSSLTPSIPRSVTAALSVCGETPEKLRELEQGWRARRRKVLGELSPNIAQPVSERSTTARVPRKVIIQAVQPSVQVVQSQREEKAQGSVHRPAIRVPSSDQRLGTSRLPTPPSTPPSERARREAHRASRTALTSTRPVFTQDVRTPASEGHMLRPVIASPLPPTSTPVPLIRARPEAVMVYPPGGRIEICIRLSSSRMIQVRQGGTMMEIQARTGKEWSAARTLRLDGVEEWSKEDVLQWKTVSELVDRFKRQTPRVKIWTDLGRLTITCSTPPDIILHFSADLDAVPSSPASLSKVRITHSTLAKELRIDIASKPAKDPSGKDTFKSSRVVALVGTVGSGARSSDGVKAASTEKLASAFGVADMSGWSSLELEAVRRLWDLRSEWKRWL